MEEHDYDGLSGRRRGKPSSKRVPLQAEKVLQLYREQYFDLNLHHFHEKLGEEQGYTWVELGCKKGPKPGVHRKRWSRRRYLECSCTGTRVGIGGFKASAGMT